MPKPTEARRQLQWEGPEHPESREPPIDSEYAFSDRNRVTRQHPKAATAFRDTFRIDAKNLIATVNLTPDADSLGRRDAGISAGHGDGFQKIDSAGAPFRHFEAPRPIHLTENSEAPLGVTDKRDVHFRTHKVILAVKFRQSGGGLREIQTSKPDGAEKRQAQVALAVKAAIRAQIIFAEDFDSNLIVCAQDIT